MHLSPPFLRTSMMGAILEFGNLPSFIQEDVWILLFNRNGNSRNLAIRQLLAKRKFLIERLTRTPNPRGIEIQY